MNGNGGQRMTLREQFGRQTPTCWQESAEPITSFWLDNGSLIGLPFFSLAFANFDGEALSLEFPLGTVIITGPKALDFYNGFSANRATRLKANGKDITSVTFQPREQRNDE